MRVVPFTADHTDAWDRLVETAPMATFLHTRRFLSYHGDRFKDASVLLFDQNGAARAVLPAALDPAGCLQSLKKTSASRDVELCERQPCLGAKPLQYYSFARPRNSRRGDSHLNAEPACAGL